MARRVRIDQLLVQRGLCPSRTRAQALIMAGKVIAGGQRIDKAGAMVDGDVDVRLREPDHPFVSRGGLKLRGALDAFEPSGLKIADRVAMDVGASTGGFTDCLLQAGASRVHAVDVGYGQLAWSLAQDPRVTVHDRRNIRTMDPGEVGEPVDLVVIDCSFISLTKILPALRPFLGPRGDLVALIKPQFEVGRERVGKGGIVRDARAREEAVTGVARAAEHAGFSVVDRVVSPIEGRDGNVEHLIWLRWPAPMGEATLPV